MSPRNASTYYPPRARWYGHRPEARLNHMAESDEAVVPEKHWFIWPELTIRGHGAVPETTLISTMLQLATVSEQQFEGKPMKRWFWHRQLAL